MINVGIVGVRGLSVVTGFKAMPERAQVVALCDLDEQILSQMAEKHAIPRTYRVYEDMLDSDIDAVVIATPMQLHVPMAIAALEAGKHVMSEVTAGVTMDELYWLIEWVEKSKKTYFFAENYCYIPQMQLVRNMVNKGLFGDLYFGEGEYLHDVRELTTYNYGLHQSGKTSWRRFWQLGKRGNFYPTHSLGPLRKCFPEDRIVQIACFGTGRYTDPAFRQEDTTLTLCQMASGKLLKLRLDAISRRPHNLTYYSLQGTEAVFEAPRGLGDSHKISFVKDASTDGQMTWRPLSDYDEYLPERYLHADDRQKSAGHWGGDYFIVEDFIHAVESGEKPEIDVYEACEWTAVGLLSELSVTNGGRMIDVPHFRPSMPYSEQRTKL